MKKVAKWFRDNVWLFIIDILTSPIMDTLRWFKDLKQSLKGLTRPTTWLNITFILLLIFVLIDDIKRSRVFTFLFFLMFVWYRYESGIWKRKR